MTGIATAPAAALLLGMSLHGQVSVLTYHNDLSRTGQNLNETILTPSNVQTGKFGRLFSHRVDGQIYGQPLYMWGLSIAGKGVHNVVFVVTEHDSVFAFDADSNTGANAEPLWHATFINRAAGVTPVPATSVECDSIAPEIGITATPVIDPDTGALYVVAMTLENFGQTYVQRLHALDVTTGAEMLGGPVEIAATAPGTGDGNSVVTFKPWLYKQRAGLLLLSGVVYTTWSSHCDAGNYHGWVIGYDAKTLERVATYTVTPNWDAGSIWQGGAAPAADANGSIFIVTANGTFDGDRGGSDLSDSVIRLSTANGLGVADYFAPFNALVLGEKDIDLGSSGVVLLPDSVGTPAHPHLLVTGSKEGHVYVIDRDQMGSFETGGDTQIVQSMPGAIGPLFGIPAYFNNTLYFGAQRDTLKAFPISNGLLSQTPASQSIQQLPLLGSVPGISANGSMHGIVWTIDSDGLHAYDAANLATELYRDNLFQDGLDAFVKFSTPTIANGKVYAGTANSLNVFGLLKSPAIGSIVNSGGYQTGAVSPGSIVSVFGTNLAASGGDVQLSIDGRAAPLLFVSPNQINAQIPYETSAGQAVFIDTVGDNASTPIAIEIQTIAPGIFADTFNQDGTLNGVAHGAAVGSVLRTYLTGLGPTVPALATGLAAPANPPSNATVVMSATIGGQDAQVMSAGLAPGLIGVFEVSLRVPMQPPGKYPLIIRAGGVPSNSVTVNVAQ